MAADPFCRLREIGRSLDAIVDRDDWEANLPRDFQRVCILCLNTYSNFRMNLGVSALNDTVQFGKALKRYGFEVYFTGAPSKKAFLALFEHFLRYTAGHVVLFYAGHGNLRWGADATADPFVFQDGSISAAAILDRVGACRERGCKLTLVTDSCQPQSLWDVGLGLDVPADVVSVSATVDPGRVADPEPAQRGLFVTDLVRRLKRNPGITPRGLYLAMRKGMKQWGQSVVVGSSTAALLDAPLFAE